MFSSIELKSKRASDLFSRTFIDVIGVFLTLTGFMLVLLSVVSNSTTAIQDLYFLKITQVVPASSSFSMTFGMYNYCIYQGSSVQCMENENIMIVPYDVNMVSLFNATYPQLFLNSTPQDQNYDPFARPDPPHNSKIYVASVLCLLGAGGSVILCIIKFIYRRTYTGFQDTYYSRGLLSAFAGCTSLLMVALCSVMYPNAVTQLNLTYPNIIVTLGPCVTMIGAAFMVFFLASTCLLRGCSSKIEPLNEYSQI